jgi:phage terminase large subunit GpA-like protein
VRAGIGTASDGEVIGWIATAPAPGKHRSYHFDALSSPFVPWDVIAKRILDAGDDPAKLKTLDNLTFGRAHKVRGNAPDHKALEARREKDLKRGHVPPRGLILVAFADVQMRGIWFEVLAIAPNRETWTVEARYIEGDTSNPHGEVFAQLKRETIDREFPDAFGRKRKIDALAVDSGYRAHVVYSVVRNAQRLHPTTGRDMILATKGLKGWGRPALGMPQLVDIDLDGKKIAQGCKVWGIGTWSLKAGVYSDLFLEIPPLVAGQAPPIAPDGYCHFGAWIDEEYFKQLTAESLQNVVHRGRVVGREWVARGPNHFFDCRVGNIALAEYLGLSSTTPEEWAELARVRGLPDEMTRVDLFTPRAAAPPTVPTAPAAAPAAKAAEEAVPPAEAWVAPSNNWMRRG